MKETMIKKEYEQEPYVKFFMASHNFFKYLSKLWWLVVVSMLTCSIMSYLYTMVTFSPVYRSEATFMVTTNNPDELDGSGYTFSYDSGSAEQLSLTFPHIISSEIFKDALKKELGTSSVNGSISANVIPKSNVITMSVTSSDPYDAQKVLDAAIKICPDVARFVIGETQFTFIDHPTLPTKPYNEPETQKNVFIGCAMGALLVMVPLMIFSVFRSTLHKENELENIISIAHLSTLVEYKRKVRGRASSNSPQIITSHDDSFLTEKFEALRMRVAKELTKEQKVLMITSTLPHEGKSLVSLNLAYYFAKHGKRVLLIDGDLRKQSLWEAVSDEACKHAKLTSEDFPEEFTFLNPSSCKPVAVTFDDNDISFDFLGSKTPENLVSGLLSLKLSKIVERLKKDYDYVLIDTPPTSGFEDVFLINDYSDAALYVVKYDYAYKSKVVEALSVLKEANAHIIGYVFNGIAATSDHYSKHGYDKYGKYGRYGYGKYSYSRNTYGYEEEEQRDEQSGD